MGQRGHGKAPQPVSIENASTSVKAKGQSGWNLTRAPNGLGEGYLCGIYAVIEIVSLYALGLAIAEFYVGRYLDDTAYYQLYITPLLVIPSLAALCFSNNDLYEISMLQRPNLAAPRLVKCIGITFGAMVLIGFLSGISKEYSRVWFVTWGLGSVTTLLILRLAFSALLDNLSTNKIPLSRVAILGECQSANKVSASVSQISSGNEIVGIYHQASKTASKKMFKGGIPELIADAQQLQIDRIIIALENATGKELSKIMDQLSILPSEVLLYPGFLGERVKVSGIAQLNDSRLIRVQQKPISDWGLLVKSALDKLMAIAGLFVLSPLFLIVAALIKLDSNGPIFFKQTRHGYNHKEIQVWKFRTMSVMENGSDFVQAKKGDARITPVGSILRKTSIDELPQLINVLLGEMSVVGPRPHPIAMNADYGARLIRYDNRHKVKPGITGLAQINGYRGPTDTPELMRKRIEFDLDYIENWSLWLDLKIIAATPYYGLFTKNAF